MLAELQVKNFALISQMQLKFTGGLNVLTGETGAGKSIIIDALGLVLGERFSPEMMRTGEEEIYVEAVFVMPIPLTAYKFLEQQGITIKPEEDLILAREINISGRNRCRINGNTVTVGTLAELSRLLVDIHGQHDHQSLLQNDKHLDLLDRFGEESLLSLRREVEGIFRERQKYVDLLSQTIMNEEEKQRRIELYTFQKQEIEALNLQPNEEEKLNADLLKLSSTEKLSQLSQNVYFVLQEEGEGGTVSRLGQVLKSLEELATIDHETENWFQMAQSIEAQLHEIARNMRNYQERIQFDPEALSLCQNRVNELQNLKRKYGPTIEAILAHKVKIEKELEEISRLESNREEYQNKLAELDTKLMHKCILLSEKRRETAQVLSQKIEAQLNELNMKNARFLINVIWTENEHGLIVKDKKYAITDKGLDHAEFLIAPNPGEEPKSLHKIASGGELSRIMLGIKVILAELDDITTMIFDEIDAGVGGRTAQVVAEKLLLIGQQRQVLCITHLPQIASMGHGHFYLEKYVQEGKTFVKIRILNMTERVQELARMLGGATVTGTTLEHAQEMLSLAEQVKLRKIGHHTRQ